jgi:hypothetical protein
VFERFTEGAREAVFFASLHTVQRRGGAIDAGDLLQGILAAAPDDVARCAPDSEAVAALVAPGLRRREGEEPEASAARILKDTSLDAGTSHTMRFAPDASAALDSAVVEASALDHKDICPEHLLLGLLRHEGTPAWQALMDAGVTLRGVREAMAHDTDSQ